MTLNEVQHTVCSLLSAELCGTEEHFSEMTDWDAVYQEMHWQTVDGLVSRTLSQLPISDELKKRWKMNCASIVVSGLRIRYCQSEMTDLLEKNGISYVVFKGAAAAKYYPDPLFRKMGDVDFYVAAKDFERTEEILAQNGFSHRHHSFRKNHVLFELHRTFATINGQAERAFVDSIFEKACVDDDRILVQEEFGSHFYALPEIENGLIILEHIAQHMTSGLGLRQVMDWMMYVKQSLSNKQWKQFQEYAGGAGLINVAKTVTKMCYRYFGLSGEIEWCYDAEDALCDEMIEYLFETGNFGRKKKYSNKIATIKARYRETGKLMRTLQKTGEHNWHLYKKYKCVRPLAWLYQLFRYAKQFASVPNKGQTLVAGAVEADRRKALLDRLHIYHS